MINIYYMFGHKSDICCKSSKRNPVHIITKVWLMRNVKFKHCDAKILSKYDMQTHNGSRYVICVKHLPWSLQKPWNKQCFRIFISEAETKGIHMLLTGILLFMIARQSHEKLASFEISLSNLSFQFWCPGCCTWNQSSVSLYEVALRKYRDAMVYFPYVIVRLHLLWSIVTGKYGK